MTQENDSQNQADNLASPVYSPEQAADAPEQNPDLASPHTRRVGESGVGAQRGHDSAFTAPTGDGNYQKVGDREQGITGEDEVQQ